MSERERSLFSFRYAVPGYVFILLLITINFNPINKLFEEMSKNTGASSFLGAVLAFLSLMSGSVLGFLITQGWYIFFHCYWYKRVVPLDLLINVIKEEDVKHRKIKKEKAWVVLDYLVHTKKEILPYLSRRWDAYNTFASTALAVFLGYCFGYIIRWYVFWYPKREEFLLWMFVLDDWINLHYMIALFSVCSIIICYFAARFTKNEHRNMIIFVLEKMKLNGKLSSINIPENYFEDEAKKS